MNKKTILFFFFAIVFFNLQAQKNAVTDVEALKLGHDIENDNDAQRIDRFMHFLDLASFIRQMERTCPDLKDPAFRRGFTENFAPGLPTVGANLAKSADETGSYRLLREYDSAGVKHLLFRTFGRLGLNYHDFLLVKIGDSVRAADVYLYTTSEDFSSTVGNLVTLMTAIPNLSNTSARVQSLVKMRADVRQKNYQEAKAVYDGLDHQLRDEKAIQMLYISVAQHSGDSIYEKALQHFQGLYPDAPNTYLLMLDLYSLTKEYAKGLNAVDRLDNLVHDPILNLFRGNYVKASGNTDSSIAYYEKAYKFDPGFRLNTKILIMTYAQASRPDDAKRVIAEYRQQKSFHQEDIDDIYKQFPSLK